MHSSFCFAVHAEGQAILYQGKTHIFAAQFLQLLDSLTEQFLHVDPQTQIDRSEKLGTLRGIRGFFLRQK